MGERNEYSVSACLRPQHSMSQVSFHRQMVGSSSITCLMRFRAVNNRIISSASHFEGFFNKIHTDPKVTIQAQICNWFSTCNDGAVN
jgi:hypothetical protein